MSNGLGEGVCGLQISFFHIATMTAISATTSSNASFSSLSNSSSSRRYFFTTAVEFVEFVRVFFEGLLFFFEHSLKNLPAGTNIKTHPYHLVQHPQGFLQKQNSLA